MSTWAQFDGAGALPHATFAGAVVGLHPPAPAQRSRTVFEIRLNHPFRVAAFRHLCRERISPRGESGQLFRLACSLKGDALMEVSFRLRVRLSKRLVLLVKAALHWLLR
jgi:hypothetical protein